MSIAVTIGRSRRGLLCLCFIMMFLITVCPQAGQVPSSNQGDQTDLNPTVETAGLQEDFQYRKEHNIRGSPGAGVNYQIQFMVHYGLGADSGPDVYLAEKCKQDFSDIRFASSDGVTKLDYWIEEKADGQYAKTWVEIKDNLDTNKVVFLYYGNPTAQSESNGDATFIFFEDGERGDLSRWTVAGSSWSCSETRVLPGHGKSVYYNGQNTYWEINKVLSITGSFLIHAWHQADNALRGTYQNAYWGSGNHHYSYQLRQFGSDWTYYHGGSSYVDWTGDARDNAGSDVWLETQLAFDKGYGWKQLWNQGQDCGCVDNLDQGGASIAENDVMNKLVFTGQSNYKTWFDDLYIRKWVSYEPTHGSWSGPDLSNGQLDVASWAYRKSHTIIGSAGAGENYQIQIKLYYGLGTDSGNEAYLFEKCKQDFSDIRFASSDGVTKLDYWIEEMVYGQYAKFWIEVKENLDTDRLIYVYFGNLDPYLDSETDADDTFMFFDDFNDGWVDTTKWVWERTGSGTEAFDETGGKLHIYSYSNLNGVYSGYTFKSKNSFTSTNFHIYMKSNWAGIDYFHGGGAFDRGGYYTSAGKCNMFDLSLYGDYGAYGYHYVESANDWLWPWADLGQKPAGFVEMNLWLSGNQWRDVLSGDYSAIMPLIGYGNHPSWSGTFQIILGNVIQLWHATGDPPYAECNTYWDCVWMTKFVKTEPMHGGWGDRCFSNGGLDSSAWICWKPHQIIGGGNAQTGYQMYFKVYTGTGTDSGYTVYLNGLGAKTDFSDVRFVDGLGRPLSFCQMWRNAQCSSFWVKVSDDLSAGKDATVYIMYGNQYATPQSNGAATFLLYDDFDAGLDTNKWTTSAGVYVANGLLYIPKGGEYVKSKTSYWTPNLAMDMWKYGACAEEKYYMGFANNPGEPTYPQLIMRPDSSDEEMKRLFDGYYQSGSGIKYVGEDFVWSVCWEQNKGRLYQAMNWGEYYYHIDQDIEAGTNLKACIKTMDSSTADLVVDRAFVRKWVSDEPQHGEWAASGSWSPPFTGFNKVDLNILCSDFENVEAGWVYVNCQKELMTAPAQPVLTGTHSVMVTQNAGSSIIVQQKLTSDKESTIRGKQIEFGFNLKLNPQQSDPTTGTYARALMGFTDAAGNWYTLVSSNWVENEPNEWVAVDALGWIPAFDMSTYDFQVRIEIRRYDLAPAKACLDTAHMTAVCQTRLRNPYGELRLTLSVSEVALDTHGTQNPDDDDVICRFRATIYGESFGWRYGEEPWETSFVEALSLDLQLVPIPSDPYHLLALSDTRAAETNDQGIQKISGYNPTGQERVIIAEAVSTGVGVVVGTLVELVGAKFMDGGATATLALELASGFIEAILLCGQPQGSYPVEADYFDMDEDPDALRARAINTGAFSLDQEWTCRIGKGYCLKVVGGVTWGCIEPGFNGYYTMVGQRSYLSTYLCAGVNP